MFRTVSPSIIRSLRLYIQHQAYVIQVLWLLEHLPADGQNGWPKHFAGLSGYTTINLYIYMCICWFCLP
jgi:hypothetical protein